METRYSFAVILNHAGDCKAQGNRPFIFRRTECFLGIWQLQIVILLKWLLCHKYNTVWNTVFSYSIVCLTFAWGMIILLCHLVLVPGIHLPVLLDWELLYQSQGIEWQNIFSDIKILPLDFFRNILEHLSLQP